MWRCSGDFLTHQAAQGWFHAWITHTNMILRQRAMHLSKKYLSKGKAAGTKQLLNNVCHLRLLVCINYHCVPSLIAVSTAFFFFLHSKCRCVWKVVCRSWILIWEHYVQDKFSQVKTFRTFVHHKLVTKHSVCKNKRTFISFWQRHLRLQTWQIAFIRRKALPGAKIFI